MTTKHNKVLIDVMAKHSVSPTTAASYMEVKPSTLHGYRCSQESSRFSPLPKHRLRMFLQGVKNSLSDKKSIFLIETAIKDLDDMRAA